MKGTGLTLDQIGVVTPYRKQVERLRTHLKAKGSELVKVGSVEEFQGQERRVIIISCVRSNKEHIAFDYKHNLGFLKNPKRFNVAVTRAKQLLIIIGNPNVLQCDKHWAELIRYCKQNGSCVGIPVQGDTDPKESKMTGCGEEDGDDALIRQFQYLGLSEDQDQVDVIEDISDVTTQQNPRWLREE